MTRIQDKALKTMQNNNLNFEQMAYATTHLIHQSNDIIVEEGIRIATFHYNEGSKTIQTHLNTFQ